MAMFVESEVERTTAATDALLGLLCFVLFLQLGSTPSAFVWKRQVWAGALVLMAFGSFLGAVAHGFTLSDATRRLVWKPLYLSLGVTVALVVVAAVHDGWGEAVARSFLPWAVGVGLFFFATTELLGGGFLLFVVYEAAGTVAALAIYAALSARGMPGASAIAAGLALSLVAAVVQRSGLRVRVVVAFDHNGLFHVIQMAALVLIAAGVRASLGITDTLHPPG